MIRLYESALWLTGAETVEQLQTVTDQITNDFTKAATQHGVVFSPIEYTEFHPIDDRCPAPPDWCSGPNVRILVGEARVLCKAPAYAKPNGFSKYLDKDTLEAMRVATRRQHKLANPQTKGLTDAMCDAMIDKVAPETVERLIRDARDSTVH